ncbi:hypothetical protein AJ78_05782 [Emergomyces pasteurianus Ep9510]|uniref:Uncharacterized protein n=1 Tax=Emergomyces pasteurianus Ep9510 TaxID=1447872 RepID=A0A1J9PB86_9EURO|nr:hypothetical protein AJ78_05782 [Emergomyces pasteurianus Ep9510]
MFGKSTKSSSEPPQAASDNSKSTVPPAHRGARERGLEIKRMQEAALLKLDIGSLYIVLYLRSDPPEPNDFHWAYYFHTNSQSGSNFLCVLVHIAAVPQEKRTQVDPIMKALDGNINSIPGVTCRVWIMKVLEMLIENGIVRCNSTSELQDECFTIGNQNSAAASKNNQPRPVVRSRVCTI